MAQHLFCHEGGASEKGEGNKDETGQRHQLELDDSDEDLDRQDEEGQHHDQPGD